MSTSVLYTIRQQLGYYGISILLITGNIGNLFLVIMLGRSLKQHSNSCSIYLFFAALSNWFIIDTVLISTLYGIDHIEPIHFSNFLCKIRWYGGHVLFMLSRCCMIAACLDRWALCSRSVGIRSICQPSIARRVIILNVLISALLAIPLFIYFDNHTDRCLLSPPYTLAYTIFACIAIGTLPVVVMVIFGLSARHNLNLLRSRVVPINNPTQQIRIHKRDHDLMKMLAGEVLIYCIRTIPYPANVMYGYLTTPIAVEKSPMRLAIEALISFIVHPLLTFTYCCTQFYVCAIVSGKFRKEFLQLFHRRIIPENQARTATHTIEPRQA